jgi:hypothetical protein
MAHESEYIRLGDGEKHYGRRNLLEFELGFFELIKQFQDYKKTRQQSQLTRLGIKKSVAALYKDMNLLDKLLPVVEDKHRKPAKKIIAGLPPEPRPKTLDDEISDIKNKLAKLQTS